MISISDAEFERLVKEGVEKVPEKFLQKLDNVAIVIEDKPTKDQLKAQGIAADEVLLGLYEGIPKTERWNYGGGVLPDKITIFKHSILADATSAEDVRAIVCETVWHEIAHHFGMDEEEVGRRESKRGG